MTKPQRIVLEQGSREWRRMRELATRAIPGKHSALYYFNAKVLQHEEVVPMTYRAHYAMCMFAEGATGIPEIDECRVKMTLVPRGLGKSTLLTKGQTLQELCKYDDWACGIANETGRNAEAFLAMIKEEFETNLLLRTLFPERIPADFRETTWRSDRIVIARKKPNPTSPSVLATGVDGTVTGVHMNTWRLDDLLSQNAAEAARKGNFNEIESVNQWARRLQPLLKAPKRDPIYIVGTRWWEKDTYEWLEDYFGGNEPVQTFLWTLKLPNGETQTIELYRRREIAVFKRPAIQNGESIFPERYTLEELEQMREDDPAFFAGQYMLAPASGGANAFQADWLRFYELDGTQLRYRDQLGRIKYADPREMTCFVSVDPAISDANDAARSAVPVVGVNEDGQFLLEDFAERGLGMFDLAYRVVDFYARYRPQRIFVETITYQRALKEALEMVARERGLSHMMSAIEDISSHGGKSKDYRIYGLEPYFKRGTFYCHRSQSRFLEEFSTFPVSPLRDVIDAISFQKDHWERVAAQRHSGFDNSRAHAAAIERIRASLA